MPVQEFECQIARGQIGRYLNGEALSSEGLRQLGIHVAECSECKGFLDHRKATLQGVLGETAMPPREEVRAVVDVNPSEALIAQIRARSVAEDPDPTPSSVAKPVKPVFTKPIIYSGILGVVLLGMTWMNRTPSGLLGPHASDVVAAAPASLGTAVTTTTAETTKTAATPTKPAEPGDSAKGAATTDSSKPAPTATTTPQAATKPAEPATKTDTAKPTEAVKAAGVTIAPTKSTKSSLIVDTKSSDQAQAVGTDKPSKSRVKPGKSASNSAKAKPGASRAPGRAVGKARGHRRTFRRRWFSRRLRPGTASIHVYRS